MSILIKGMEMPTRQILAVINPNGLVEVLAGNTLVAEYEAIPVPPHGRLVDEKDIVPKDGYIIADGMACIPVRDIVNAPTIIPAEEGE